MGRLMHCPSPRRCNSIHQIPARGASTGGFPGSHALVWRCREKGLVYMRNHYAARVRSALPSAKTREDGVRQLTCATSRERRACRPGRAPAFGRAMTNLQAASDQPRATSREPFAGRSALRIPRSALHVAFSQQVIHNGVCPRVHVKNHQIRVKIDQKGDVFRQKAIKNERISSCPS